jgi:hypothetical protein
MHRHEDNVHCADKGVFPLLTRVSGWGGGMYRAYEHTVHTKKELESVRMALSDTQAGLEGANATIQAQLAELATHRKLAEISEEGKRLELSALEAHRQRLSAQLDSESAIR